MEFAAHQVVGGGDAVQAFHFRWPWQAANTGFAHQHGNQALAHLKFHTDRQLRMNPARAVGLPGRDVDFGDQLGEPPATHLSWRPVFLFAIARATDTEKSAAKLGPVARLDKTVDYRVDPFGPGRSSPKSLAAIFDISASVSRLPNSFLRLGELCSFRRGHPGSFASIDRSIDLILAHPAMQSCRAHAELNSRSRDGFAGAHEGDCSQSKLGGEWSRHGGSLSKEGPNPHAVSGNQTVGQVR